VTDPAAALAAVRDALLAAGAPPGSFQLAGAHESTPLPTDFWFARPSPAGWEVGAYERGTYSVHAVVSSPAAVETLLRQAVLPSSD
jgi:hypothetical protein